MKNPLFLVVLVLAAAGVQAHDFQLGTLSIGHPYARPTAPSQPTGGGYMKIANQGKADDKLVSASSPVARGVQMHTMRMEGDVMRMREVDAVDVPSGKTIELKPGGLHLMLMGLKEPLVVGQKFPLTLRFDKAGEVTVQMSVDTPASGTTGPTEMRHDKAH
ncbi:MAG: copper chaperone PCu(A)C [Caldimonas sp.]